MGFVHALCCHIFDAATDDHTLYWCDENIPTQTEKDKVQAIKIFVQKFNIYDTWFMHTGLGVRAYSMKHKFFRHEADINHKFVTYALIMSSFIIWYVILNMLHYPSSLMNKKAAKNPLLLLLLDILNFWFH